MTLRSKRPLVIAGLLALALLSSCAGPPDRGPVTISGDYSHATGQLVVRVREGVCSSSTDRGPWIDTPCFQTNGLIYFKAGAEAGEEPSRNVWVAYRIRGERLISSHVEDVDDGTRFYEGFEPTIVLEKRP